MENETKTEVKKKDDGGILKTVIITAAVCLIANIFGGLANVNGESMTNTLQPSDKLLYQKVGFTPAHGDIIIAKTPKSKNILIKRVIGVPGDVIDINFLEHKIYRNGEPLDEPYIKEQDVDYYKLSQESEYVTFPITVGDNEVFAMGDNRNNSFDCRNIGCLSYQEIQGKVLCRLLPISSFGNIS